MHGQYDWTRDPALSAKGFDWDTACPGEQWRHSHNYLHHTFTNIQGKDRDIGYGILRMSEDQPWHPVYLANPVFATLLALNFDLGVMLHDVEFERVTVGQEDLARGMADAARRAAQDRQALRQGLRPLAAAHRAAVPVDARRQRRRQRDAQRVGVHDHLLRPLPRRHPRVHDRRVRGRVEGPLVLPSDARLGEHRGRQPVPRDVGQPQPPDPKSP